MTSSTRIYEWHEVEEGVAPLSTMSGLAFFQGMADGSIAKQPINSTIGWTIDRVEFGMLRLSFVPEPWLIHAGGLVHGGVIATLLDSAMAGSIMSTLAQGQGCTTLQLSITPIRSVRPGDNMLFIEGRTTNVGKRIGVATGEIRDSSGRLCAQGSTTCLIF